MKLSLKQLICFVVYFFVNCFFSVRGNSVVELDVTEFLFTGYLNVWHEGRYHVVRRHK